MGYEYEAQDTPLLINIKVWWNCWSCSISMLAQSWQLWRHTENSFPLFCFWIARLQMRLRLETITSASQIHQIIYTNWLHRPPKSKSPLLSPGLWLSPHHQLRQVCRQICNQHYYCELQLRAFYMSFLYKMEWHSIIFLTGNCVVEVHMFCPKYILSYQMIKISSELWNWIFSPERIDFPLLLLKSQPMDRPLSL